MKNKKIIIGVSIGAAVLVGGFFAYRYFKKRSTKKNTGTPPLSEGRPTIVGGMPVRYASTVETEGRPTIVRGMPVRYASTVETSRQNA